MAKKVCTKCHRKLDLTEFNKRHNTRDGLAYYCKECVKSYSHPTGAVSGGHQLYKKVYKQGLRRAKLDCVMCSRAYPKPYRVVICRDCYEKYIVPMLVKMRFMEEGDRPIYRLVGGNRFVFDRLSSIIPEGFYGDNSFPKRVSTEVVSARTAKKVLKAYTTSKEGVSELVKYIKAQEGGEVFLTEAMSG